MSDARGWYLYALLRRSTSSSPDVVGIDDAAIELVEHRDLAAAVSDVRLAEVEVPDDDVAEGSRLARLARRHDEVIRALFAQTVTLPLQLGTVVKDKADVEQIMADRYDEVTRALDELAGAEEWGVRVRRPAHSAPPDRRAAAKATSGTAYLAGRKAALQAADEERRHQADLVHDVVTGLSKHAREIVETSRGGADTMMDVACLVDRTATDSFLAAASEQAEVLEPTNAELTVTGPWPPYTFARSKLSVDSHV